MPAPVAVIGSGPSSFACCLALVERGVRPIVVDAGLKPGSRSVRAAAEATDALPDKTVRGSDHPYRLPPTKTWNAGRGVGILPSFAAGGHSTVWGASMLPYTPEDMGGWPIGYDDLAAHYRAVTAAIPFSGVADALSARYPLNGTPSGEVISGSRMTAIRARAAKRPPDAGLLVGGARVAVDACAPQDGGCHACGMCMYGCPDNLIFDAGIALGQLAARGLVDYRPGLLVQRWRRDGDGSLFLDVEGLDASGVPPIEASRVFVGAGVLSTAEIVIRSRELWGCETRILDSQYFVGPLVSARAERETDLSTLAQVFVEVRYGPDRDQWAHCQIYPPNHFVRAAIRGKLPHVPGRDWAANRLARRMFPIQGFLPSRDSGTLSLMLDGPGSRGPTLASSPSDGAIAAVKACATVLARQRRLLGGQFVAGAVELADVGRSFHIGGSFPMAPSATPDLKTTDILGRLDGEPNVHLIDASVLPSISGATITLTVMANAHRIAASALDSS